MQFAFIFFLVVWKILIFFHRKLFLAWTSASLTFCYSGNWFWSTIVAKSCNNLALTVSSYWWVKFKRLFNFWYHFCFALAGIWQITFLGHKFVSPVVHHSINCFEDNKKRKFWGEKSLISLTFEVLFSFCALGSKTVSWILIERNDIEYNIYLHCFNIPIWKIYFF